MDVQERTDFVVSRIYRGATAKGSWDPALSAMVELFEASTVCLRISHRGSLPLEFRFASGRSMSRERLAEWDESYGDARVAPNPPLGAVHHRRFREEYPGDPVTEELFKYDITTALLHNFATMDGADYVLAVTRGEADPDFEQCHVETLRRIGVHFAEAVKLRHETIRANQMCEFQASALDKLGVAGILIDPYGNVLPLNNGAERILASMDFLRLHRHNKLVAVNRRDQRQLKQYLDMILGGEVPEGETFAMSLERSSEGRPVGVIINSARTMCTASHRMENCALMFVRDSETDLAIDADLVQKLFSFTPAEASLAIGLAAGQRLNEIEEQMHIRHNTARAHLRSIFVKADVSRQAELVRLFANSVAPLAQRGPMLEKAD